MPHILRDILMLHRSNGKKEVLSAMPDAYDQELSAFRQLLAASDKSHATIEKYCRDVRQLLAYLERRQPSRPLLLEYRRTLCARHRPQTVNGKLTAINTYLKSVGLADCCVKLLSVQRRAFIDDARELTDSEYRRLLAASDSGRNERLRMIMETLCGTGIRISELRSITVEAASQGRAEIALKGKIRVILIPKKLRRALLSYAAGRGIRTGCIFRTRSGQPVDRSNIWRDMKRLCARAGVDRAKVFPHNLRHLFARAYYAIEKNLSHLADILGHSSVETTRIYLAVSAREHERTLDKMRLII